MFENRVHMIKELALTITGLTLTGILLLGGCKPSAQLDNHTDNAVKTVEEQREHGDETMQASQTNQTELATFAAGCFWGVEATFQNVDGVITTRVGYTGGHVDNPTYKNVCTDTTGHAEAIEITFDPTRVTYQQLLDIFWKMHDPTALNRQGPDVGTQYRSAIFYHSPEQQKTAEASKKMLSESDRDDRPIVTQIVPVATFYEAEEYHQKYLQKKGLANCHLP